MSLFSETSCSTLVTTLKMDEAIIRLNSPPASLSSYSVTGVYGDCYECPPSNIADNVKVGAAEPTCVIFPTNYGTDLTFGGPLCSSSISPFTVKPNQLGVYDLNILSDDVGSCKVTLTKYDVDELADDYLPLVFMLAFLLGLAAVRFLWKISERRDREDALKEADLLSKGDGLSAPLLNTSLMASADFSESPIPTAGSAAPHSKRRINSLDAFRGLSLTLMIFVNYGGGGYYFFNHSTWNGLTVADLLFPWFVWIMGVTVGATFKAPLKGGVCGKLGKVFGRCLRLFFLGLLLNSAGVGERRLVTNSDEVTQYFISKTSHVSLRSSQRATCQNSASLEFCSTFPSHICIST